MGLALLLSTSRLWLPTSAVEFPQIPCLESLCTVPLTVDWWLTSGLCLGLGLSCIPSSRTRWPVVGSTIVLGCGLGLVALNQHRLQPWFYQLLIFYAIFLWAGRSRSASTTSVHFPTSITSLTPLAALKAIVLSIYFYSAIGKFDFEFLHTVGQNFLDAVLSAANVDISTWSWSTRLWMAGLLPTIELLLAVGLAVGPYAGKRFMRWAVCAVCLFHIGLMAIFGLGLGHSAGVILWNLQFSVQAWLLFAVVDARALAAQSAVVTPAKDHHALPSNGLSRSEANHSELSEEQENTDQSASVNEASREQRTTLEPSWGSRLGSGLVLIVVLLPLLERWGYWDHWTSWALYAPHSSRVEVQVAPTFIERLPEELQRLLALEMEGQEGSAVVWVRVPLSQWSLVSLGSPIYPQARFELGVARALAAQANSRFAIQVTVLGAAGRFDGRRTRWEALGTEAIDRAGERFFWNTRPRF